jgi:hypothetical protein
VKFPILGRPIEQMMVKEHEPFAESLLANLKAEAEAKQPV